MGWFHDESDEAQAHRDFTSQPHEAKFSHEVIGGAAAYEAMKGYEEHEAANGQEPEHAKAKEIAAGLAGAFIDREAETRGLDAVDAERAKSHAEDRYGEQMENSGRW